MTTAIFISLLTSAIRLATPLLLAALAGVYSERSGVVNIALEGIMIAGAFFSVLFTHATGSAWFGVLAGIAFGVLTSAMLAVIAINLKGNQVIAGTAINLLMTAVAAFLLELFWHRSGSTPTAPAMLTTNPLPFLESVPLIGTFFKQLTPFVYMAFVMVAVTYVTLWKMPWGLRVRAVGEHPRAAETVGIDVYRTRWICVLISGGLAGLAGTALSIGTIGLFREGMVAGKGFIALAALVFGKWHPVKTMMACLFFGLCSAVNILAQSFGVEAPTEVLAMIPYVATLLVLIGIVGKAQGPKAAGDPYDKDDD